MIYEKWLDPVKPMLKGFIDDRDWEILFAFDQAIEALIKERPTMTLLQVKETLASQGFGMIDNSQSLGGMDRPPLLQALIQFVCGYHGLDYRDIAHAGHGRMVLLHGSDKTKKVWGPKIANGALIGIAATEEHGGSNVQNSRTSARKKGNCYWLTGEKCHVSRLQEASAFVVFLRFRGDESLSAVLIEPTRPGVSIELWDPVGLRGYRWGKISFKDVPFHEEDLLGVRGQGGAIFKDHFAYYRPMVGITALGVAAAVFDIAMANIVERVSKHYITNVRDSTLESLGEHYASIIGALLYSLNTVVQYQLDSPHASLLASSGKAWAVEQAYDAVSDLNLILGAAAFRSESFPAKAFLDLRGYLYADGIHAALNRSAGRTLLEKASNITPSRGDGSTFSSDSTVSSEIRSRGNGAGKRSVRNAFKPGHRGDHS